MSYTIKINGLDGLSKSFRRSPVTTVNEIKRALQTSVDIIRPIMVKEAPHSQGGLRENIYARVTGMIGTVGPDLDATPYAIWVHSGTGIYAGKGRIFPKRASVLKFKIGGRTVFAKSIKGQKANPFVDRTAKQMEPYVQKIFDDALDRITKSLEN